MERGERKDDLGLLRKLFGGQRPTQPRVESTSQRRPAWMTDEMSVILFEGRDMLEVVGESHYQEEIQSVVRHIGREVVAVLVPEPENPYDSSAVSVWVAGVKVGHLSRSEAETYQQPIVRLMEQEGQPIAVAGTIHG